MKAVHLLMFSGGVDSTLCLHHLVEQGITPFLVHFKTKKLRRRHERMIRRVARHLSPRSPYYVFHAISRYDQETPYAMPAELSIPREGCERIPGLLLLDWPLACLSRSSACLHLFPFIDARKTSY